jgi:tetratricopeptide (TPR) repeat protein
MVRRTVSQAPIHVRDSLNRAVRFASSGDFDSAVDLLLPVICKYPAISVIYDKIREFELNKLAKQGGGIKLWVKFCSLFTTPVVRIIATSDPLKAMAMCEKQLAKCIDNPLILSALADACAAADAPWGSVSALNALCKLHPGNAIQMRRLADAMQRNGQGIDALKVHQDIISKSTDKKNIDRSGLQAAMVMASIERGNFNDQKTNKANTADADDAIIQQLLDGTIHDADQAQLLIDRFSEELRRQDSVDMRRKMADAYMVAGKYEDALREYRAVADRLGVLDPLLDKHIEKAYISHLESMVAALRAEPEQYENPEAQIAELEKTIYDYRWKHTRMRAERFPNDMQLQFDLGELQFECEMFDDAEKTFTAVAENPQKRRGSLVYLGRCALLKKDAGKAIGFLQSAVEEMSKMDKYKREALYYLGNAQELAGDKEKAIASYRQISVSMSNYRDIQQRMKELGVE